MLLKSIPNTKPISISDTPHSMTLSELLSKANATPISIHGDTQVPITGIQHNSKEISPGDLFVCCFGSKTDGHLYITEACEKGASAVVVTEVVNVEEEALHCCRALVIVEDTNSILPRLAASFFGHPSKRLSVVGITGTNGKTTTTHLVKSVFEAMGSKSGMLGTLGYCIDEDNKLEAVNTTPDALTIQRLMAEMARNRADAIVMEASSHGLELGRCDEIDFDVAVFTNLTRDHLDFHVTEERYRESKLKLFDKMLDPDKHRKVVNIDDPNASYFIARGNADVPLVTFGMDSKNCDVRPLGLEISLFGTKLSISTPKGVVEINSALVGRYNVYNILAAVSVGIAVGGQLEEIKRGIEGLAGVPGRCELIDEGQNFGVIVDYAHTPDALSRLLDAMRELAPKRIITVFGCGGQRDSGKRPLMTRIATNKSDVVILTSDNPRNEDPLNILEGMLAGVGWTIQDYVQLTHDKNYAQLNNGCQLLVHDLRRVALQAAIAMGKEGDIIVVAGKGHETYQIEGETRKFFDDREECREALRYVRELKKAGIDISELSWGVNRQLFFSI
ncbi:uncharacterized protein LOC109703582 isoform X1 [Ananas comosus]|uniref:UDP-N-acetylmuramoyl-L-alanyl-D-glutamate--2,6-diaminopimelate ligase MurE homolog, chloroplastic n=1 Tax=Ananas comosus TaxID=4615 RepID=A0A6P5EE76_ANACO|nr:uncharacterized protein LOC109703582 isoform X1 [Ananas comosus]